MERGRRPLPSGAEEMRGGVLGEDSPDPSHPALGTAKTTRSEYWGGPVGREEFSNLSVVGPCVTCDSRGRPGNLGNASDPKRFCFSTQWLREGGGKGRMTEISSKTFVGEKKS